MRKTAPAALRNREAIASVLRLELPKQGTVLEIASGSGEHVLHFAEHLDHLDWQPSDVDREAIASILACKAECGGINFRLPILLDAARPETWEVREADAILCINMVHICPWAVTEKLFEGAARVLSGKNLPLILYGPYFEQDVETAPSNLAFDESLRARNPDWGIRDAEKVDTLAEAHGFRRTARHPMPANNITLVYRTG